MTVSAHDVAAVLRERLPDLPTLKLHKLLYYAQGFHLAAVGAPLFAEPVLAWDKGPVVGSLWQAERNVAAPPPRRALTDGQLNIVDYVISRYGRLSGVDLMHTTHAEAPWRTANEGRPAGGSVQIRNEWMRDYFLAEPHDEGEMWFAPGKVAELTAGAAERRRGLEEVDDNDGLWATFEELLDESRA
jgi:uncharacterized phage-associated protein